MVLAEVNCTVLPNEIRQAVIAVDASGVKNLSRAQGKHNLAETWGARSGLAHCCA